MKKRLFPFLIFFLIGWIIWGNASVMTTCFTVKTSRIPAVFSGYCIAQVSDLHNAEFGSGNAALLQALADADPNIIVITGDLVDSRHTDLETARAFAVAAAEIAPVYYTPGNHEARLAEYEDLKADLTDSAVTVLEDVSVKLEQDGAVVHLVGLTDPAFSSCPTEDRLAKLIDSDFTIVLSHRPELFDIYVSCGADLVFCGHAHGGQIRLPLIGGLYAPHQGFFPRYDSGLYQQAQTTMVVSRGLGNSLFPFRLNNRPELVVVTLESES